MRHNQHDYMTNVAVEPQLPVLCHHLHATLHDQSLVTYGLGQQDAQSALLHDRHVRKLIILQYSKPEHIVNNPYALNACNQTCL